MLLESQNVDIKVKVVLSVRVSITHKGAALLEPILQ